MSSITWLAPGLIEVLVPGSEVGREAVAMIHLRDVSAIWKRSNADVLIWLRGVSKPLQAFLDYTELREAWAAYERSRAGYERSSS